MLQLQFAGWYQCRLATDPDPYDDPRGQSGWTFAMPGEPDLDRIIRFQNPIAPRSYGPQVGVGVQSVQVDGNPVAGHPLEGAMVELIGGAVYEGRNGQIAPSAQEPIAPFHLQIQANGMTLLGRDPIDLNHPIEIERRQPIAFKGNSALVRQVTKIPDPQAFRANRRSLLEADLAKETDPVVQQALNQRIQELGKGSIRLTSLGFQLDYDFELRGPHDWTDPNGVLGPAPAANQPWNARFWMGGWDADALCAYVSGTISIP